MNTRTVHLEFSPGSIEINECPHCEHMCLITAEIVGITNEWVGKIGTYQQCEECDGEDEPHNT